MRTTPLCVDLRKCGTVPEHPPPESYYFPTSERENSGHEEYQFRVSKSCQRERKKVLLPLPTHHLLYSHPARPVTDTRAGRRRGTWTPCSSAILTGPVPRPSESHVSMIFKEELPQIYFIFHSLFMLLKIKRPSRYMRVRGSAVIHF